MMRVLKNKKGTTLVELVVCMVLLSLFTLAAVTLIQPSAQAYMDIQQQTRAQNLADALIETIRGELLNANGYIRFADGATDNNFDTVFDKKSGVSSGTALEFSVYPNHIELIDKDNKGGRNAAAEPRDRERAGRLPAHAVLSAGKKHL